MTRPFGTKAVLFAIAALCSLPLAAGGDASLLIGEKSLSDSTLDDAGVDGQSSFGVAVNLDFDWPVLLAIDLLTSSDNNNTTVMAGTPLTFATDVETMELDVGVRKRWGEKLQPYAGAGLALVTLDARQSMSGSLGGGTMFDTLLLDDSGTAVGLWINAGLLYRVTERFNVSFDLRNSNADVSVTPESGPGSTDLGAGGTQYAIAFGVSW